MRAGIALVLCRKSLCDFDLECYCEGRSSTVAGRGNPCFQGEIELPDSPSSLSLGLTWAYRIIAVAAEMVLPGLAGAWLDRRFGTGFLALAGFGLGVSLGLWHLIVMTRGEARQLAEKRGFDEMDADGGKRD